MNLLEVEGVRKTFTLHLRGGEQRVALAAPAFQLQAGECLVLRGPSGAGKSTLLRCIYGTYRADGGSIRLRYADAMTEIVAADPRHILGLRRWQMAYASQFLRVIPRVPSIDLVAEAALAQGVEASAAQERARAILLRLQIPISLHALPPANFSGGEQQRVNLARALIGSHPLLLLDEPTASLDSENAALVLAEIQRAKLAGRGILAILHDPQQIARVADREIFLSPGEKPA